jgi:hypothetical protein
MARGGSVADVSMSYPSRFCGTLDKCTLLKLSFELLYGGVAGRLRIRWGSNTSGRPAMLLYGCQHSSDDADGKHQNPERDHHAVITFGLWFFFEQFDDLTSDFDEHD